MCTQEAITYLDNIDLRAVDFWKGYKLFCFSHYSQSALLKAQFLSSKMGAVVLHSVPEGVIPWSAKFRECVQEVWEVLEDYVQIRHGRDCKNLRALMEEYDDEEQLSTIVTCGK